MHEHALGRAQAAGAGQVAPCRADGLGQAGGVHEVELVGHVEELPDRDDEPLRVPPARDQRGDAVSDRPAVDAAAQCRHRPGRLQAGPRGCAGRRRVVALALHQVGTVHARGGYLEEDLARAGGRVRDLADGQLLGSAGADDLDDSHVDEPRQGSCARGWSSPKVGGARTPARTAGPDAGGGFSGMVDRIR
jgi:hypothetical protein